MKKILLLGLLSISTVAVAKECLIETNLKIRQKPSLSAKILGSYEPGEVVSIKKQKNGWIKTEKGWIRAKYCSILKNEEIVKKAKSLGKLIPDKEKPVNPYEPVIVQGFFSFVPISITDVNRISCPSEIKWYTYSKEKEIQITKADKNLLVKILPKLITKGNQQQIKRENFPRELLVECEGQIFTVILVPKKIPTQTVILKPKFSDKKKALKFETSNPYETTIKQLIKKAYRGEPIDGYSIRKVHKPYKRFKQLNMDIERVYIGAVYKITEYSLTGKQSIDLTEKLFIPYLNNPVAISLTKLHLNPGEKARMFVIEKQEDN